MLMDWREKKIYLQKSKKQKKYSNRLWLCLQIWKGVRRSKKHIYPTPFQENIKLCTSQSMKKINEEIQITYLMLPGYNPQSHVLDYCHYYYYYYLALQGRVYFLNLFIYFLTLMWHWSCLVMAAGHISPAPLSCVDDEMH